MLLDTKNKVVNPDTLPKGREARAAALAPLREVLVPRPMRTSGGMFKLQSRARLGRA